MKVKKLLDKNLHRVNTISPDEPVSKAIKLMSKKETNVLVVTDNGNIVGILTDADYDRKVILKGKKSRYILVREIMTTKVISATPNQTLSKCLSLMTKNHFRHLPVTENEELIGILSIEDIRRNI